MSSSRSISQKLLLITIIIYVNFPTTHQIQTSIEPKLVEQVSQVENKSIKLLYQRQSDHLQLIRASVTKFTGRNLKVCVIVREPFVIYTPPIPNETPNSNITIMDQANKNYHNNRKTRLKPREDLNNYSGVAIEVTKRFVEIFNLNVKVVEPADRQFGVQDARTGKWTGLLGSLVRNESDLGVTALSITSKRAEYVDFTRAYYVETSSILLKTPEEIQDFLVIFEPFSPIVWCLLFITILWLIIVITIMTKLEDHQKLKHEIAKSIKQSHHLNKHHNRRSENFDDLSGVASVFTSHVILRGSEILQNKNDNRNKDSHNKEEATPNVVLRNESDSTKSSLDRSSRGSYQHEIDYEKLKAKLLAESEFGTTWTQRLYYSITCVLNILLTKDIKHPPRQTPIRILVCVWWLATIVIVNFYLGTLFEQLVLPRRQKLIDTLEELVNQDKIGWGVTAGSAMDELFSNAKAKSVYWQIGQRMQTVTSADEGVKRVIDTNFAFIRERSILKFKVAQEHRKMGACKMQLAKEEFFSVGFGLAVPKNSPYLEAFNAALTLMIENGFVARWQSEYWPEKSRFTECQSVSTNEAKPLSLKHFLSIFLVWLLFIGLGFIVLVYQLSVMLFR